MIPSRATQIATNGIVQPPCSTERKVEQSSDTCARGGRRAAGISCRSKVLCRTTVQAAGSNRQESRLPVTQVRRHHGGLGCYRGTFL